MLDQVVGETLSESGLTISDVDWLVPHQANIRIIQATAKKLGLGMEHVAISQDDSNFVGVMRDGYPVYGRRDPSGMVPTDLDAFGGHTSVTVDSPSVAVYHYHVNLQTSTSAGTLGQQQWFLTKGTFRGTPGACTGCN